jgi:hypothetical protein
MCTEPSTWKMPGGRGSNASWPKTGASLVGHRRIEWDPNNGKVIGLGGMRQALDVREMSKGVDA